MVKSLHGERSLRGSSAVVGVGLSRFGELMSELKPFVNAAGRKAGW